ncbi:two-component sensor histidine kinase [Actinomadura sp. NBRC 104425]|uniref:sensor histidine kinase n=1 Tax=Actinomadura sp. NBRC 104425 TaxID=3032204 RepID=UPI0024A0DCE2|nr:HAMP domain-containing sensor histidine kinase [Actinomadura sp. NBRC 104425]GLZ13197.1 two-component sensor histidine kinase [Actinomadura sp. NBRC 104425]
MRAVRRMWPFSGSVRARMTLLYGGLFTVITSAVLVGAARLQQEVLGRKVQDFPFGSRVASIPCDRRPPQAPCASVPYSAAGPGAVNPDDERGELLASLASSQRLITVVAIAVIAVLAFAVCWWLTGRLLRPLHHVTATARRLSLSNLHERIALGGPQNELKELADTFDAMLDRLERAVASQRRFVANASHELRTPLAIQRTAIEIGLADPTPAKVERIRAELLRNTQRSERLIEGLLTLAQGERGLDTRDPVDLGGVVEQVVAEHRRLAERGGVAVSVATVPVTVVGDEVMLARLVANLVQNAIRHNHPGGRVAVELAPDTGLVVSNTGPLVPPERVGELFEPFRRLHAERTGAAEGAGLGLSIVAAIARAHDGAVHATANPDGGLRVTVALPVRTCVPPRAPAR